MEHHLRHQIRDPGVIVVELDEPVVPLERPGGRRITVEGDPEHSRVLAVRTFRQCPLHQRMFTADVIEHPVEEHADPAVRGGVDQLIEIAVVPQSRVDTVEIQGVVAVGGRIKDRSQLNRVESETDRVIQPVDQSGQPVGELTLPVAGRPHRGTGESQGIDVPDDGVIDETHDVLQLLEDRVQVDGIRKRRSDLAPVCHGGPICTQPAKPPQSGRAVAARHARPMATRPKSDSHVHSRTSAERSSRTSPKTSEALAYPRTTSRVANPKLNAHSAP